MKTKNLALLFMLLLIPVAFGASVLSAQELNCKVQINSEQISGTDKGIYENLKKVVEEFMNSQRWSNLQLNNSEKIDCSITFIMKTRNGNTHTCDFQIQATRPVYGSTYTTSLLNTREDLTFDYQENQPLTFNETSIDDNLTATLAFWSYVILGLDFDSFSKLGGTPFYQKAQEITSIAQGSLGDNWKAQEDKNHWGWINTLTDENQPEMRILSYNYHRLGLDVMYLTAGEGRTQITTALSVLKAVKQAKPRSPLLSNFIDTKADELINIFTKSTQQEKVSVYDLLTGVYPASSNRLQGIKTKK
jgi:Domain of unknown function (DUF4835)